MSEWTTPGSLAQALWERSIDNWKPVSATIIVIALLILPTNSMLTAFFFPIVFYVASFLLSLFCSFSDRFAWAVLEKIVGDPNQVKASHRIGYFVLSLLLLPIAVFVTTLGDMP